MVVSSVQHSDSVFLQIIVHYRFPGGSENAGDLGLIPGSGRSPREGNGTHSSTLAWRIPWREEPGRLQSMGSQRVEHN